VFASVITLLSRGQELVELPQVRQRHVQRTYRFRLVGQVQRRQSRGRPGRSGPCALEDGFHVVPGFRPTALDGALHGFGRLLRQQLHHPAVVPDTAPRSMLALQVGAQLRKQRRQLPASEEVGVV
jgi:hypothetical protein